MNGSGRPVTGISPTVIPMFMTRCANQTAKKQKATRLPKPWLDSAATLKTRRRNQARSTRNTRTPIKPSSSPHDREDEIGVLLGEEGQPLLGSQPEALPRHAAGTDGHLRLNEVPPGAPGVDLGIEKHQQSTLLVWRQSIPQGRGKRSGRQIRQRHRDRLHHVRPAQVETEDDDDEPHPPHRCRESEDQTYAGADQHEDREQGDARPEERADQNHHEYERAAEVRLGQHEEKGTTTAATGRHSSNKRACGSLRPPSILASSRMVASFASSAG